MKIQRICIACVWQNHGENAYRVLAKFAFVTAKKNHRKINKRGHKYKDELFEKTGNSLIIFCI